MGPPEELVLLLKRQYHISCFVETGTHRGGTAAWGAEHFDRVVTIERSKELYQEAQNRYGHLGIDFVNGDTRDHLNSILSELKQPGLFWLDAHWSGGQTYGADDQCPLIEELRMINDAAAEHFLLIDDARLFLSPPPRPHRVEQWPTICEVVGALQSRRKRYTVISEDVIISVPEYARCVVAQFCQEINTAAWAEYGSRGRSRMRNRANLFYHALRNRIESIGKA